MLTNAHIQNASPREREYMITDSGGLAILIKPNGSKLWRFRYTLNGKKQKLSIGVYPDVTLSAARIQAANARAKVAQGISPVDEKAKAIESNRSGSAFRDVYSEWYQSRVSRWADSYARNITRLFDMHILPAIGSRPVANIEPPDVLKLLKKIEAKGSTTVAGNVRARCAEVFAFAVITGKAKYNPARDLTGALQRHKKGHFASLDASELGAFLNVLTTSGESLIVISLIRLLMLTGLRPTEAREGAWLEVDFDAALWRIPAERMKGDRPHVVPLSRQVLDILKFMHSITGPHGLIFPNQRDALRAMSPGLVGNLIHRCGYGKEATGHGFRHTMSTVLHEQGYNTAWIEAQLAHADKNTIRSTYNHAQYLDNRREMLQWYADHIDELHRAETPLSVTAGGSHD